MATSLLIYNGESDTYHFREIPEGRGRGYDYIRVIDAAAHTFGRETGVHRKNIVTLGLYRWSAPRNAMSYGALLKFLSSSKDTLSKNYNEVLRDAKANEPDKSLTDTLLELAQARSSICVLEDRLKDIAG